MKTFPTLILFFTQIILFAQMEISQIEDYRELIFNVQSEFNNSIGTAFIVGKSERYYFLVTAKHVLHGENNVTLFSIAGSQHKADFLMEHDVHDLALLKTPIFPINGDRIPIVTALEMKDEVAFLSAKDLGKIFPNNGSGIVRDVTGESISVIMNGVEPGHSGSPLLSKDGIAGIIIKRGRFIESINILLVNEIIDEWGEGLFEKLFVEQKISRIKLAVPNTVIGKE